MSRQFTVILIFMTTFFSRLYLLLVKCVIFVTVFHLLLPFTFFFILLLTNCLATVK